MVVLNDAVAAAEAGKDNIDVGIAEDGITRGRCDLGSGLGAHLVEFRQGLLLHVDNGPAFVFRLVSMTCCTGGQEDDDEEQA